MKVRHTLICFFFLSLQDGNTGLTNAQITFVYTRTEGGEITVTCPFSSPGDRKFFCRRECKPEDILIETTGVRAQRGRYSIRYERGGNGVVSITQLTKSDSGLYRCGSDRSNINFEIIVIDALLGRSTPEQKSLYTRAGRNIVVQCSFTVSGSRKYFCKEECEEKDILVETTGVRNERGRYSIRYIERSPTGGSVYVSITQLTKSDSGRYRCGLDRRFSTDHYWQFEVIVPDALLDGSPSEEKSLSARAGGNIVVGCSFTDSGRRKYFCKEECEEKDILVETTGYTAERGRYRIRYIEGSPTGGSVFVSITQLTKSDSGRYGCGLDRFLSRDPYREFEIIVTDGPTSSKPKSTLPFFSTSAPSASTTTQTPQTDQHQIETAALRDVWLPVSLTLAIMIILLLLAVVIYCRKRSSRPKEAPVETEYSSATETNQVYENIRKDRHSRSAPVENSSVYTLAKYTKQKPPESTDDYSSVTAATCQNTAEDCSSKLTYSEVIFSKRTVGSSTRALRGDDNNVVYSVPRL